MLKTAQIKHSHTAVGTATDKHIYTAGTKAYIENLFVVGDELGLCGESGNVPDGTCGVNAGGDDEFWG